MSNYSQGAPPPPPPPPPPQAAGPTGATPWYRRPGPLFLLGVVVAAAVAVPVLVVVLGGDDDGTVAGSTTSTTLAVTTTAATTTEATTTTAAATTTTTEATTTTAATTTTTEATTTTIATGTALDYRLPALFGEVELDGLRGDPWSTRVEAGGPIRVDYPQVADCYGWTTAAPSFELTWTSTAGTLLRFYFVADDPGADAVLLISDPYADWACNDDYEAGIYDPAVDFYDSEDGVYDIWVATYNAGETVTGTLYITQTEENHP